MSHNILSTNTHGTEINTNTIKRLDMVQQQFNHIESETYAVACDSCRCLHCWMDKVGEVPELWRNWRNSANEKNTPNNRLGKWAERKRQTARERERSERERMNVIDIYHILNVCWCDAYESYYLSLSIQYHY